MRIRRNADGLVCIIPQQQGNRYHLLTCLTHPTLTIIRINKAAGLPTPGQLTDRTLPRRLRIPQMLLVAAYFLRATGFLLNLPMALSRLRQLQGLLKLLSRET